MAEPGFHNGRHCTTYVGEVNQLRRDNRLDEAESLLLGLLDAVEEEARVTGGGVAPWYYEQLATVYRKKGDLASELLILERFCALPHGIGSRNPRLFSRLEKVRQAAGKSASRSAKQSHVMEDIAAEFEKWQREGH